MNISEIPADTERMVVRLVRVSSLVSIAVGVLALFFSGSRLPAMLRLTSEDALGLLFIGFAIRLSRLADYRRGFRVMLNTCRYSLLLLGAAGIAGLHVAGPLGATSSGAPGFASGVCFLVAGAALFLRRRYTASVPANRLCTFLVVYICACWISLVLFVAQIAPIPRLLAINPLLLIVLSAATIGLSAFIRNPGIVQLIAGHGVETDVARGLFAASLGIPVAVALFSRFAEDAGWMWRGDSVLAQVLMSVGCMIAVTRLQSLRIFSLRRSIDNISALSSERERMCRQILDNVDAPVWIFGRDGSLSFLNNAARSFSAPGAADWDSVLSRQQQNSVLNAALFGCCYPELSVRDAASGTVQILSVRFLGVFNGEPHSPEQIVLVANSQPLSVFCPGGASHSESLSALPRFPGILSSDTPVSSPAPELETC